MVVKRRPLKRPPLKRPAISVDAVDDDSGPMRPQNTYHENASGLRRWPNLAARGPIHDAPAQLGQIRGTSPRKLLQRPQLKRPAISKFKATPPRIEAQRPPVIATGIGLTPRANGQSVRGKQRFCARRFLLRPVVLRFSDVRERGMATAFVAWSKIFAAVGGRTSRVAAALGAKRGRNHLCAILRRWSHRTLHVHATNVLKFLDWHRERWSHIPSNKRGAEASETETMHQNRSLHASVVEKIRRTHVLNHS